MKTFYACLDAGFVKYAPQPLQHLAVSDKARKLGGQVSFYTMEDFKSLATQGAMRAKIEEQPAIEGVIYFTIQQFFYGGNLGLKFLKFILDRGYEAHFAREDLSIPTQESLDHAFPMLYSSRYLMERDKAREYWKPIWSSLISGENGEIAT